MPRQDVPYGGAICRLKERLAEIWDKLGEKLHSINGVEGDAAGDVKIVSADPAIVITNNAASHEIEIGLDSLELPSAAVTSVNGQTGAVALDAGDIPSDGNSDVQTDIDVNKAAISACSSAITSEQLARQNADSTLQGNINTLSASIPTAAATAVANDPTVAQLATDVPNKVDKITSGSSLKAYTHTGATQGETSVEDGIGANTIGIRDANGYLKAASPATGVYNDNLANGTKVKNELDNYPQMIRTANNQKKSGVLWVNDLNSTAIKNTGSDTYFIFARLNANVVNTTRFSFILSSRGPYESGYYCLWAVTATTMQVVTTATQPASFKIVTDGTYQYFAALVQNNNIKRITFIDHMDAFDRQIPDMTLFAPYAVTTETDVMVSI